MWERVRNVGGQESGSEERGRGVEGSTSGGGGTGKREEREGRGEEVRRGGGKMEGLGGEWGGREGMGVQDGGEVGAWGEEADRSKKGRWGGRKCGRVVGV